MKKILLMLSILVLMSFSVVAQNDLTIKQFLDSSTNQNTIVVMGDMTSDTDAYFVMNRILYANNLKAYAQNDAEINDLINTKKNIILIGGPCINSKFWGMYSDETCENWPYATREYLVKAVKKGDQSILLISGTNREDTFNVIERISNSPGQAMFAQSVVDKDRVGEVYNSKCAGTTDYCKTLTLGYQVPYESEDKKVYELELLTITDTQKYITFKVNGAEHILGRGESITIDGIELTFDNLGFDYSTGKATKAILSSSKKMITEFGSMETPNDEGTFDVAPGLYFLRFSITGEVIKFFLKEIGEDNSYLQIDINGKQHSMAKGDSLVVDGVKLTVKDIKFDLGRVFFEFKKE